MPSILLWAITVSLFLIGVIGTIIPGLPGIGLVFAGILLYGIATDFAAISVVTVVGLGLVGLLALAADYAGSIVGTKMSGGKKWAIIGTLIGTIIGAFASPLGMFVGAFLGAFIGAVIEGQQHGAAAKTAIYSVIGILGATVVQLFLALAMIAAFVVALFV